MRLSSRRYPARRGASCRVDFPFGQFHGSISRVMLAMCIRKVKCKRLDIRHVNPVDPWRGIDQAVFTLISAWCRRQERPA